jgi:hypothetical protein
LRILPTVSSAPPHWRFGEIVDVGAFLNRYEPWKLGINVVGCRLLTPVAGSAPEDAHGAVLERNHAEADPPRDV